MRCVMSRFFEFFIGSRYLRTDRSNRYISAISIISLSGVALGVAVLLVVLSVMNGFERELRTRILSITAHATVSAFGSGLSDWPALTARVQVNSEVQGVAPYIEKQAMLVASGKNSGALIGGILPEEQGKVADLAAHMQSGSVAQLQAGRYGIVLGAELAKALGVKLGDRVVAVIAQGSVTVAGVIPIHRRFTVVGIFSAGMYEYDRNLAYVHMADAARLYRMGDEVTGLRLKLANPLQAPAAVADVARQLGGGYYVDDWTRQHANFFRSIALTKSMMFIILSLVVAVAAFNIIATLVMVVKNKQGDIAILRTLGASPRSVLAVFLTQGTIIGAIGTLAGVFFGALIAFNLESLIHGLEYLLGIQFMDAKQYYMSDLPAAVEWGDVLRVAGVAFGLCCLSTLYPAWRAARTEPAKALRRE